MFDRLKKDLIGGVVFVAPIVITLYVAYWVFNFVMDLPGIDALPTTGIPILNRVITFLIAMTIIGVFLVGVGHLTRTVLSKYAQEWRDNLMNKIPILRLVYKATKLAVETLSSGTSEFKKPVKIEVSGVRLTGFKTGTTQDGRNIIFLPTTPNITTGFLLELEDDKVQIADETLEEALTRILSIGFGDSRKNVKGEYKDQDIEEKD
ncbi:hypothetical protein AKJ56_02045 [candidate division MSBL1 archaeon SCGC-AAA382N08]|uniref:DUF502 domain-containing protein n=1 Tax=candidate division MSBL1 archaeon SCGC-AAA382N08 TaxID=1698285 RepID=A0A133VNG7_9EURY|nr:hypothetical protein AKJ56_02045 [candidate division MSBL1 archaeon SCGC-AAA382N08]